MSKIITLRVNEDTKRKIKRYSIPVSQVARAAILHEIERKEDEEAMRALRRMKQILSKVDMRRITEHIREDRESR